MLYILSLLPPSLLIMQMPLHRNNKGKVVVITQLGKRKPKPQTSLLAMYT